MQVLTTNEDSIFVENIHKVSSEKFEHVACMDVTQTQTQTHTHTHTIVCVRVCMYACVSACVYTHACVDESASLTRPYLR